MVRLSASLSYKRAALFVVLFAVGGIAAALWAPSRASSQSLPTSLVGYAWSDTIGWIDLNCSNTDSCASSDFGIRISADGALSGYGWSEHIGWVSATTADLSGCPSAPCSALLTEEGLQGWLRALGGGTAESGGWDGWISLGGESPDYGVSWDGSLFSGYAWGSTVIGWLDFSFAGTDDAQLCTPIFACTADGTGLLRREYSDGQCVATTFFASCEPGSCSYGACVYDDASATGPTVDIYAVPAIVRSGSAARLFWNSQHAVACSVRGDIIDTIGGGYWDALASPANGLETSLIQQQTVYTLSCTGEDGATALDSVVINILPVFQEL